MILTHVYANGDIKYTYATQPYLYLHNILVLMQVL